MMISQTVLRSSITTWAALSWLVAGTAARHPLSKTAIITKNSKARSSKKKSFYHILITDGK